MGVSLQNHHVKGKYKCIKESVQCKPKSEFAKDLNSVKRKRCWCSNTLKTFQLTEMKAHLNYLFQSPVVCRLSVCHLSVSLQTFHILIFFFRAKHGTNLSWITWISFVKNVRQKENETAEKTKCIHSLTFQCYCYCKARSHWPMTTEHMQQSVWQVWRHSTKLLKICENKMEENGQGKYVVWKLNTWIMEAWLMKANRKLWPLPKGYQGQVHCRCIAERADA